MSHAGEVRLVVMLCKEGPVRAKDDVNDRNL